MVRLSRFDSLTNGGAWVWTLSYLVGLLRHVTQATSGLGEPQRDVELQYDVTDADESAATYGRKTTFDPARTLQIQSYTQAFAIGDQVRMHWWGISRSSSRVQFPSISFGFVHSMFPNRRKPASAGVKISTPAIKHTIKVLST